MPIDAKDVKLGRCYTTANGQHRRVVNISKDNKVTYESWGGNVGYQGGSLSRNTVDLNVFAKDVEKEIPCPRNLPSMPIL